MSFSETLEILKRIQAALYFSSEFPYLALSLSGDREVIYTHEAIQERTEEEWPKLSWRQ